MADLVKTLSAFMSGLLGLFIFTLSYFVFGTIITSVFNNIEQNQVSNLLPSQLAGLASMFSTLTNLVLLSFLFGAVSSVIVYWFLISFLQRFVSYQT